MLVATDPRAVSSGWVADYVFVERGFEFFAAHAEAFPDADTPAVSIDSPSIALTHILDHGGSCYLSRSTIVDLLAEGRLFEVTGAPKFRLDTFVVRPDEAQNPELMAAAMDALKIAVGAAV